MKKKFGFLIIIMLFMIAFSTLIVMIKKNSDSIEDDKLKVVSSFYPIYIILENLTDGVSDVAVSNLTSNQTGCLHDYELSAKDMKKLDNADLLIINGANMESFLDDIISIYPKLTIKNSTEGIELINSKEQGHEHDDESEAEHNHEHHDAESEAEHNHEHHDAESEAEHNHAHDDDFEVEDNHEHHDDESEAEHNHEHHDHDVNGHVWMDMNLYIQQIENVLSFLCELDKENFEKYEQNAKAYIKKVNTLKEKYANELEKLRGTKVIIFHDSFAYMASNLGIEVAYSIELEEDEALSASEVAKIIDIIKKEDIKYLLIEEQYSVQIAKTIASETGASLLTIDTLVTGDGTKESYINGMEKNLAVLTTIQ